MPDLIFGAASLAFGGVCAALVVGHSGAALEEPSPGPAVVVPLHRAWTPDGSTTETTMGEIERTEVQGADRCEDATNPPDGTGAPEAPTRGATVSEVAQACPPGREHGGEVSAVAHSDTGKPGHGGTTEVADDAGDDGTVHDGGTEPDDTTTDNPAEAHGGGKGSGRGGAPADPGSQGNGSEAAPSPSPRGQR